MAVPSTPSGPRWAARLAGITALLSLCGCDALRTDRFLPLWAALPAVVFLGAGGLFVFERRRGQLRRWDLREEAQDPGVSGTAGHLIGAAAAAFAAFATYNGLLDGAGLVLRLENVGLWLLGSAVGVALALLFGVRSAERSLRAGGSISRRT